MVFGRLAEDYCSTESAKLGVKERRETRLKREKGRVNGHKRLGRR